jgi:hypothetical protein
MTSRVVDEDDDGLGFYSPFNEVLDSEQKDSTKDDTKENEKDLYLRQVANSRTQLDSNVTHTAFKVFTYLVGILTDFNSAETLRKDFSRAKGLVEKFLSANQDAGMCRIQNDVDASKVRKKQEKMLHDAEEYRRVKEVEVFQKTAELQDKYSSLSGENKKLENVRLELEQLRKTFGPDAKQRAILKFLRCMLENDSVMFEEFVEAKKHFDSWRCFADEISMKTADESEKIARKIKDYEMDTKLAVSVAELFWPYYYDKIVASIIANQEATPNNIGLTDDDTTYENNEETDTYRYRYNYFFRYDNSNATENRKGLLIGWLNKRVYEKIKFTELAEVFEETTATEVSKRLPGPTSQEIHVLWMSVHGVAVDAPKLLNYDTLKQWLFPESKKDAKLLQMDEEADEAADICTVYRELIKKLVQSSPAKLRKLFNKCVQKNSNMISKRKLKDLVNLVRLEVDKDKAKEAAKKAQIKTKEVAEAAKAEALKVKAMDPKTREKYLAKKAIAENLKADELAEE